MSKEDLKESSGGQILELFPGHPDARMFAARLTRSSLIEVVSTQEESRHFDPPDTLHSLWDYEARFSIAPKEPCFTKGQIDDFNRTLTQLLGEPSRQFSAAREMDRLPFSKVGESVLRDRIDADIAFPPDAPFHLVEHAREFVKSRLKKSFRGKEVIIPGLRHYEKTIGRRLTVAELDFQGLANPAPFSEVEGKEDLLGLFLLHIYPSAEIAAQASQSVRDQMRCAILLPKG